MAVLDLVLAVVWVLLVAGVPGYVRQRRTGEAAIRWNDPLGSPQWWSRLISVAAVLLAVAAPLAELAGLAPFDPLDQRAVRIGGLVLVVLGAAITVGSQLAMGDSWRGDVDPDARTELVTTGPFRLVRNPIFSGAIMTAVGLALAVPNVVSLAMLVAFLVALEIQVRLVEEPFLLRVHGATYRSYAARTGRFVPGVGRFRA